MFQLNREWLAARRRIVLGLLDLGIAVTAGAVLLYLIFGPVRTPLFSVSSFAKPFLQAFVLASIRAGLSGPSWLPSLLVASTTWARGGIRRIEESSDWGRAAWNALVVIATTRLASKAVGFAANLAYPEQTPRSFDMPFGPEKFAETFAAWDSAWYIDIAQNGYEFRSNTQSNIAFFPLYPLLIRLVAGIFGGGERAVWMSAIAISYACFFVGLLFLYRLTERKLGDREAARRAVLYLAVFPFSFPFTRVYTESLFLATSIVAVWCAKEGKWAWAGLAGALATLARPNGILIAIPLVLVALHRRTAGTIPWRQALALLPIPGALGLYCAYAAMLSGDPLAWLHAQDHWGYSVGNAPWATVQQTLETIETRGLYAYLSKADRGLYALSHACIGLVVLALTPSLIRTLGIALGAYVAISILVPFTGNALEGIGRYSATLFPVFMYLGARVRTRGSHEAMLVVGSMWLALNVGLFVTQRPVY